MNKTNTYIYSRISDESLMAGIANADTKAFNELYNRYKNRLLYYFYRMLGNSNEKAQDFLQDLFFKVIDKPEMFDSKRKFSTWIFSIAHNICKNEYRRLEVRKNVNVIDDMDTFENTDNYTEKQHHAMAEEVYKELEEFDEIKKSAFLLKYREGFSIKEISKILELPEGTIKSRLFYTRKKLYERLQNIYVEYKEALDHEK